MQWWDEPMISYQLFEASEVLMTSLALKCWKTRSNTSPQEATSCSIVQVKSQYWITRQNKLKCASFHLRTSVLYTYFDDVSWFSARNQFFFSDSRLFVTVATRSMPKHECLYINLKTFSKRTLDKLKQSFRYWSTCFRPLRDNCCDKKNRKLRKLKLLLK